jgi:MFS family permease
MQTNQHTSTLMRDLRTLPRSFWVLFVGTFINRFGTFVWPFLTIYLTRQGFSTGQAAMAVSAFALGSVGGNALGGWLSDRIGRRNTIAAGTLGVALLVMGLHAAHTLPFILFFAFATGLANGTYHPAATALIADLVPPELRVRAYAAFRLAANAGFAFGAALGGLLANYSFFWLFAGDALTSAAYGVIALLALPHGLRARSEQASWREAVRHLRTDRAFHVLFAATFCASLIFSQFGTTYSLHILRGGMEVSLLGHRLAPETLYGLLIGWNGVMVTFCELPLSGWTRKFQPRRVMALGYILLGAGFGLNALGIQPWLLWTAMTLFTLGEMLSLPISSAYVAAIAPTQLRGRYMGMNGLAWSAAGVFGPQVGFRLLEIDPALVWGTCLLLGLAGAGILLRWGQRPQPIEAATAVPDTA